jgi:Raf kinase inhibitor-like YbhB/YbcL family protein
MRALLVAALLAAALAVTAAGCGGGETTTTATKQNRGVEAGGGAQAGGGPAGNRGGNGRVKLRIEEFENGGEIPVDLTCDGPGGPPLIEIRTVPGNAAELALLVTDPDAPGGEFFHWGVLGIKPSTSSFGSVGPPPKAVETTNDTGEVGYAPPCPPPGDGPHRYVFTLHALAEPLGLDEGVDPATATEAVEAASIADASVTGTFER